MLGTQLSAIADGKSTVFRLIVLATLMQLAWIPRSWACGCSTETTNPALCQATESATDSTPPTSLTPSVVPQPSVNDTNPACATTQCSDGIAQQAGATNIGYNMDYNATGPSTTCRFVDNNTNDNLFVPQNTANEFTSFINNAPPGVSFAYCVDPLSATTVSLAATFGSGCTATGNEILCPVNDPGYTNPEEIITNPPAAQSAVLPSVGVTRYNPNDPITLAANPSSVTITYQREDCDTQTNLPPSNDVVCSSPPNTITETIALSATQTGSSDSACTDPHQAIAADCDGSWQETQTTSCTVNGAASATCPPAFIPPPLSCLVDGTVIASGSTATVQVTSTTPPTSAECPNGPGTRQDEMSTPTTYSCDNGTATETGTGTATETGFTGACAAVTFNPNELCSNGSGYPTSIGCTLYVSTTGSDSNAGTQSEPFATILKASESAKPGSIICVAPGAYAGGFVTTASGTAGDPITYISTTQYGAVISGTSATAPNQSVWENHGSYVVIEGFEVTGSTAIAGLYATDGASSNIFQCNLAHDIETNTTVDAEREQEGYGGGGSSMDDVLGNAYGNGGENGIVNANIVYNVGPPGTSNSQDEGIYIAETGTVSNNIVYNTATGIAAYYGNHVTIVNNTIDNTLNATIGNGIIVGATGNGSNGQPLVADYDTVGNNIIANSGSVGIGEYDNTGTHNTYYNNLIYNSGTPYSLQNGLTGSDTVIGNPDFVNESAHEYELQAGSPAIGAGSATNAPPIDFGGNPRPTPGGGYDIGAYQYAP